MLKALHNTEAMEIRREAVETAMRADTAETWAAAANASWAVARELENHGESMRANIYVSQGNFFHRRAEALTQ